MDKPDILMYQHNFYKPLLDKAIKLTEQYVSDHKLILTGGMAIDLALRLKNKSIYSDDQLPDYDVLSDQNLFHAHELARILCENEIPNVNVINAVHITTVRVRIKRDVLLDATYVPASIYNKIPYLDAGNLRVVHPHYQFIDQRSSLGMLMLDKGLTLNIFNRLEKDIERNDLLREEYPIQSSLPEIKYTNLSIPLKYIQIKHELLNQIDDNAFIYTGPSCITGYAAFYLYMNIVEPKKYPITINNDNLEIKCPDNFKFSLLSYDIDAISNLLHNPKTYRQLLSLKPISLSDDRYEIIDSYGIRISCFIFKLPNGMDVCVSSTDYILSEFLRDRTYVSKEPYTSFYCSLLEIVSNMRTKHSDNIWFPSINCYGFDNLPEYKVFDLERIVYPDNSSNLKPKNEYLRNPLCLIKNEVFDSIQSHYFKIDGAEDDSIKHTNYKYIVSAFNELVKNNR